MSRSRENPRTSDTKLRILSLPGAQTGVGRGPFSATELLRQSSSFSRSTPVPPLSVRRLSRRETTRPVLLRPFSPASLSLRRDPPSRCLESQVSRTHAEGGRGRFFRVPPSPCSRPRPVKGVDILRSYETRSHTSPSATSDTGGVRHVTLGLVLCSHTSPPANPSNPVLPPGCAALITGMFFPRPTARNTECGH